MVWGAVAGTAASCLLGYIWYGQFFLGVPWMRATHPGKTSDQIAKETGQFAIMFSLVSQAFLVTILQYVMRAMDVSTVEHCIQIALTLSIIETLTDVSHCVFCHRSLTTFLIDHGYNLAILVAMSLCVLYFG